MRGDRLHPDATLDRLLALRLDTDECAAVADGGDSDSDGLLPAAYARSLPADDASPFASIQNEATTTVAFIARHGDDRQQRALLKSRRSKMAIRTAINPTSWSVNLGFDQAQLVEGHQRLLLCSGQDAVDATGSAQHAGDMAAQLELAVDNLQDVLAHADMSLADVVRLTVYTTDFDELVQHWSSLTDRFGSSDDRFVTSVLGVTRLFTPELLVMLEATAVA